MSWGYVAVGVGTLVGGYLSGEGSKDAAETAANAQGSAADAGVSEQRRQFNLIQELLSPYTTASTGSGKYSPILVGDMFDRTGGDWKPNEELYKNSPEYRNAWEKLLVDHQAKHGITPNSYKGSDLIEAQRFMEGQGFSLDSYNAAQQSKPQPMGSLTSQRAILGLDGPEAERAAIQQIEQSQGFQSSLAQGENAMLQNASATGGLRGGNIQAALAQFRPQMLNQAIEQQYSRLAGMTALGQNAAAGVGNAGMQTGTNVANLLQQQGAALAGGALMRGQVNAGYANIIPQVAGAYAGYQNNFGGQQAPAMNTSQQYGTVPGSQQTQMLQAQDGTF